MDQALSLPGHSVSRALSLRALGLRALGLRALSLPGTRSPHRKVGEDGTREFAKPKSDRKPDIIKTEYKVTILPPGKKLCFPFDTSAKENDLLVKEGCIETTPSLPSKIVDWTGSHSDDNKTPRESALIVQSEIQDNSSSVNATSQSQRKESMAMIEITI